MDRQVQVNPKGIELIKSFEGLEDGDPSTVNLDFYVCPAKFLTLGWGHVITYNGRMLKDTKEDRAIAKKLYPNGITKYQAEELLKADVASFSIQVRNVIKNENTTSNQFSACVSLAFNIGMGNFMKSSVLRLLNAGDLLGAANNFWQWRKADGKILPGLVKRREAEKQLFLS